MYTPEREQKHRELMDRLSTCDDLICRWNTLTEDEDETKAQELQSISIFSDILNPQCHYLTKEGTEYIEARVKACEDWIEEKKAEGELEDE